MNYIKTYYDDARDWAARNPVATTMLVAVLIVAVIAFARA